MEIAPKEYIRSHLASCPFRQGGGQRQLSQKERILKRLSKDKLTQLANAASGAHISDKISRSVLIRIVKESLSITEINREIKKVRVQSRQRWRQRWFSTLVLIAMMTVIGVSLVPINLAVSRALLNTQPEVQWSRTYGLSTSNVTAGANSVQQTSDGGYIVAGYDSNDIYGRVVSIVKVDREGMMQWNKAYGSSSIYDEPYSRDPKMNSVRQTSDGGYVIVAHCCCVSGTTRTTEVLLVKIDSHGNLQWNGTYGGGNSDLEFGYDVKETSDGGYIVAGEVFSGIRGFGSALLLRIDSKGTMLWSMSYGDLSTANSVEETPDGGYVFAGYESVPHFGSTTCGTWLVRTDHYGNALWNKTYKMGWWSGAYCVEATSEGGYIIGGEVYFERSPEAFLIKTDSNGNAYWTMFYGGDYYACAYSVHQTDDGGYVIGGHREGLSLNESALWVLKTDQEGRELWSKTFNGNGFASGRYVQVTSDGGYIAAGTTSRFGNYTHSDALIVKLGRYESSVLEMVRVVSVLDVVFVVVCLVLVMSIRRISRRRDHLPSSRASTQ
jgi:hypothetical protein